MKMTIRTGPFSVQFTNKNDEMGLRAHSHFATVELHWRVTDPQGSGFPVFQATTAMIQAKLTDLLRQPVRGTNEEVARVIWRAFHGWKCEEALRWGPHENYELERVDLHVRGVPDDIGHSDGFATYTLTE